METRISPTNMPDILDPFAVNTALAAINDDACLVLTSTLLNDFTTGTCAAAARAVASICFTARDNMVNLQRRRCGTDSNNLQRSCHLGQDTLQVAGSTGAASVYSGAGMGG